MNIIEKGHLVTITTYSHTWHYENDITAGYGIDCDWMGVIDNETHKKLYNQLMTGVIHDRGVVYDGIEKREHSYWEPTIGECSCGNQVVLDSVMYNTCSRCGRDYNSFGQLLGPRSQWGEETGETFFDIDMANYNLNDREGINSLWDDD
jgi:hypothetical protein